MSASSFCLSDGSSEDCEIVSTVRRSGQAELRGAIGLPGCRGRPVIPVALFQTSGVFWVGVSCIVVGSTAPRVPRRGRAEPMVSNTAASNDVSDKRQTTAV